MGFNWRVVVAYFAMALATGVAYRFLGLTQAQARLMDVITAMIFIGLLLCVNPVARHNIRQMFRRDGHQWRGDGPDCEECS